MLWNWIYVPLKHFKHTLFVEIHEFCKKSFWYFQISIKQEKEENEWLKRQIFNNKISLCLKKSLSKVDLHMPSSPFHSFPFCCVHTRRYITYNMCHTHKKSLVKPSLNHLKSTHAFSFSPLTKLLFELGCETLFQVTNCQSLFIRLRILSFMLW